MTHKKHHSNSESIHKHKKSSTPPEKETSAFSQDILTGATPCMSKPSKAPTQNGGIRIINSKNGKRLEFSKRILSALNNPKEIKFLFKNQYLVLETTEKHGFPLKGQQNTIFSAALINEIVDKFSLNFDNCTCVTFSDFKKIDVDPLAVAVSME
jgi:hypothetical protein